MAKQKLSTLLLCVALLFGASACGSLEIQNVNYAQPIESVLAVDSNLEVHDQRYAIKFNISPLLEEEGVSSVDEIRLIRNSAGYYFLTANGFSNVYVLEPQESELKLKNTIEIPGNALVRPAFNQRDNGIELVDMETGNTYNLDQNGRR